MVKTDKEILIEEHQFIWSDEENDDNETNNNGQKALAQTKKSSAMKYDEKLVKDFVIVLFGIDPKTNRKLSGMRWRTQREVLTGKGETICGEEHCTETQDLMTTEAHFAYVEKNVKKSALVDISNPELKVCLEMELFQKIILFFFNLESIEFIAKELGKNFSKHINLFKTKPRAIMQKIFCTLSVRTAPERQFKILV